MNKIGFKQITTGFLLFVFGVSLAGCASSARGRYFGKTVAPDENTLHYISGAETEFLDPQLVTAQNDARVSLALFEGLVEYDPKTMQPIPSIAERWESNKSLDEYVFHLRKNAKWSDGKPITAKDFVYSFRRALDPETLSRSASFGYYIKYAEPFNSGDSFVKKNGEFLLAKDFAPDGEKSNESTVHTEAGDGRGSDSEFHKFISSPPRLTVHTDAKLQAKQVEANPKLKIALENSELVPIAATDLGVEAIDDFTVRITLNQPAPFFIGLLCHQFFRLVPQHTVEKHGKNWTRPENIVTNGAFKLHSHKPYHELVVVKDPNYWDADKVKLDRIEFYPIEDQTTAMNLYKAGSIDAFQNHNVPASWKDEIFQYKDEYLNHPEMAIEYYAISVKKPPMDNIKLRQAFSLAINREELARLRKTVKPLYNFTPEGIFPEYEAARAKVAADIQTERKISPDEWKANRSFNPAKSCALIAEAGFKVTNGTEGKCKVEGFPVEKVSVTYNTVESNRQVAEFVQAQWKQNLGITVSIKNMEWKAFLPFRNRVEYEGFVRHAWVGDYVDPFTFLDLHRRPSNQGATGWWDKKYDDMLDAANSELDPAKRYELLARAEYYMLDQQIVMPLATQATNWMKKPFVKGMYPNPGTLHAWKYVYIERDPTKWDTNVDDIMK